MRRTNVIGVAGAGAWGVALANAAAAAGREVILWGRDARGCGPSRRRGAASGCQALTGAARSRRRRISRTCAMRRDSGGGAGSVEPRDGAAAGDGAGSAPLVTCAKGIERGTHAFMTEVLGEAAPGRRTAILSGPSFAADVAAGLPTAVTLASADEELARALCDALRGPSLEALSFDRRSRRRDRRGGQERAGDRLRRRCRPRARRERRRGFDRPRFRRTSPFWRGFRRARIDADGPFGSRRSRV